MNFLKKTYLYATYKTHFRPKDPYRLKVKGQRKILHINGSEKKDWSSNIDSKQALKPRL